MVTTRGARQRSMAQNMGDRPEFYNTYIKQVDRSKRETDLRVDPIWSRINPLLPEVRDKHVLDLGCGSGWFCRWAASQGAKSVVGIDLSDNMLERAREFSREEGSRSIEYRRADIEKLSFGADEENKYGLVFSSLTLHYLHDINRLMTKLNRILKPGGYVVFNVEHPIYTAPHETEIKRDTTSGERFWKFNHYHQEGERISDWMVPGVKKQHRTITTYVESILQADLDVSGFVEFIPTKEELDSGVVDDIHCVRPLFLMMSAKKRAK